MRIAWLLAVSLGLVISLSHVAPSPSGAQEATPAESGMDCPSTTPEENTALIERYWAEVWTAGGEEATENLLAEDEVHHWGVGGDTVGPEAFNVRLTTFLTAFPDFAIVPDEIVAQGDMVASHWTATGTHEGEWLGVPASDIEVEYTGSNFFRIACGKIVESWGEADHLSLLRQIGGLPDVSTPVADPGA